jgi:hypothetical protein
MKLNTHHETIICNKDIILRGCKSFKNVLEFNYLRTTLTDTNGVHDEIRRRINLGYAFYYSVQKLLSPHLLS